MTISVQGVVAHGKGEPVELTTVLVPEPGPGEALVTVQATFSAVTRTRSTIASCSLVQLQAKATLPSPQAITACLRRSTGPTACVPWATMIEAPAW